MSLFTFSYVQYFTTFHFAASFIQFEPRSWPCKWWLRGKYWGALCCLRQFGFISYRVLIVRWSVHFIADRLSNSTVRFSFAIPMLEFGSNSSQRYESWWGGGNVFDTYVVRSRFLKSFAIIIDSLCSAVVPLELMAFNLHLTILNLCQSTEIDSGSILVRRLFRHSNCQTPAFFGFNFQNWSKIIFLNKKEVWSSQGLDVRMFWCML